MNATTMNAINTNTNTYTAIEIAAALCGKVAAWHMIIDMVSQGSSIDDLARDIRAEISRSPSPTNTRKGAGKSLSNMISLIRRAQLAGVPLVTDKGAAVPVGKLEKACQIAEGVPDTTDAPAAPTNTATATPVTYDAAAWRQQEDALLAAQAEIARLREIIAQAAYEIANRHYKQAAKALLAA